MNFKKALVEKNYIDALEQTLFLGRDRFMNNFSARNSTPAMLYYIDLFRQYIDYIEIAGWAFVNEKGAEVGDISIIFRNELRSYIFKTCLVKREDVAAHFESSDLDRAGFSVLIPRIVFEDGNYTIGICVKKGTLQAVQFTEKTVGIRNWKEISIPEVKVEEITGGLTPQFFPDQEAVDGNVWDYELAVINQLIHFKNASNIFEIGTFDGRTALSMAANSKEDAFVFTLDLPKEKIESTSLCLDPNDLKYVQKDQSGSRMRGKDFCEKIIQLFGDSASFDFSPYNRKMDVVFVDGSHSYEYVLNDTHVALNLLKDAGGIVLWHDYGVWEGVTKALNKLYAYDSRFSGLRHIEESSLVVLVT